MTVPKSLSFIIGCLICISCGCRTTDSGKQAHGREYGKFRIEWGEQGGFTGGYSGYAIDGEGNVARVSRIPGRVAEETPWAAVSLGVVAAIRESLLSSDFFQIDCTKPGNMVYVIKVHQEENEHSVAWPAGDEAVPEALEQLRQDLQNIILKIKPR